jgi:hypothetical protein
LKPFTHAQAHATSLRDRMIGRRNHPLRRTEFSARTGRVNKPNPLPWVATSCLRRSMVSRASAVGCHPLREVPSLRGRRSMAYATRRCAAATSCCNPGTGIDRSRSRCMPRGSCRQCIGHPVTI